MMETQLEPHLKPAVKQCAHSGSVSGVRLMKDTLAVGTIAGIAGTIVMHVFSFIFKALNLITVTTFDYSASIFLNQSQLNTTAGLIVGAIAHFLIGAAGGVLLAYFIRAAGKDYYWLKGLALSGFMLLGGMGLVLNIMNLMPEMRESGLTVLLHIITYAVYGLTTSYIIARFGQFETVG